jgi:hypothetical protein
MGNRFSLSSQFGGLLMRRLRNFMIVGLMLMTSACSGTGQVTSLPDNPENRAAAAKKCLEAMPPKDMLEGLASRVAPNMPEKDRKAFLEVMSSPDLEKATSRIMEEGLAKNFTVSELTALTAFYGSPEGKSASKKFGPYMAGVMPQVQQEVKKGMEEKQKQQGSTGQPEPPGPKASPAPQAPAAPMAPVAPKASPAPKEPAVPMAPVAPKAPPAPQTPKEAPK